jgi:hypothetical protein
VKFQNSEILKAWVLEQSLVQEQTIQLVVLWQQAGLVVERLQRALMLERALARL